MSREEGAHKRVLRPAIEGFGVRSSSLRRSMVGLLLPIALLTALAACVPAGLVNATSVVCIESAVQAGGPGLDACVRAVDALRSDLGPLYDGVMMQSERGRVWLGGHALVGLGDRSVAIQLWRPVARDVVLHAYTQEEFLVSKGVEPYAIATELQASVGSAECLRGRAALAAGQADVAEDRFAAALRSRDFDPRLAARDGCYWDAARAAIWRGDTVSAATILDQGLSACTDCWTGHYLRGRVYAASERDYDNAVTQFLYAHQQNPGWLGIYVPLVEALIETGDLESARSWAEQGLERSDTAALRDLADRLGVTSD